MFRYAFCIYSLRPTDVSGNMAKKPESIFLLHYYWTFCAFCVKQTRCGNKFLKSQPPQNNEDWQHPKTFQGRWLNFRVRHTTFFFRPSMQMIDDSLIISACNSQVIANDYTLFSLAYLSLNCSKGYTGKQKNKCQC